MTTYENWIDRIDNLITIMKTMDYRETITMSFNMSDLIQLKLIITTYKELAEKVGEQYESTH